MENFDHAWFLCRNAEIFFRKRPDYIRNISQVFKFSKYFKNKISMNEFL